MAWLSGWTYRKEVTLSRASGAVINYQLRLLVGESAGATGEDVDCNSHILSDFDDLRFTKSDGSTLLDYLIKSITGTTPNRLATVEIEFDSIGTGATTFYMYYGKSSATVVSNGDNTFLLYEYFDDLITGNLAGQDSWAADDLDANESLTVATDQYVSSPKSGKAFCGNATDMYLIGSKPTSSAQKNLKVEIRMRANPSPNYTNYHAVLCGESGAGMAYVTMHPDGHWKYYDGSFHNLSTDTMWSVDTWYELTLTIREDNTYDIAIGGLTKQTNAPFTGVGMINGVNWFGFGILDYGRNYDNSTWVDDITLRHFLATEPAWGSWGSEEEEEAPPSGTSFVAWIN